MDRGQLLDAPIDISGEGLNSREPPLTAAQGAYHQAPSVRRPAHVHPHRAQVQL